MIEKFLMRLMGRSTGYASVTVPRSVSKAWKNVEKVEMEYDDEKNTLVINPCVVKVAE